MDNVTLVQVTADHPDLNGIITKLDHYLLQVYPPSEIFGLDLTDSKNNKTIFIVAYFNEIAVGCGAIKPIDDEIVELKRFFVDPEFRNRGIATAILNNLENRALALNYSTIRLETGEKLPEAIILYQKHGYYPIDKYGEYVDCESSLCYEKQLR
ncbi:GNAT superfamily N-acetyltransferase [Paenibacillus anaericanus]|uniref:GNAT family N-acetyltransferase n=1 Tax=Paenibacillus anaericanus TaxID=170367 RepID=UPI00277D7A47|nr:GNAT family N-acetyltransferase [Paenibacillus anaericanus]MDQ0089306.1 GNAT superfamily N-acetyltransferase [Paenibacillus anaericanus]